MAVGARTQPCCLWPLTRGCTAPAACAVALLTCGPPPAAGTNCGDGYEKIPKGDVRCGLPCRAVPDRPPRCAFLQLHGAGRQPPDNLRTCLPSCLQVCGPCRDPPAGRRGLCNQVLQALALRHCHAGEPAEGAPCGCAELMQQRGHLQLSASHTLHTRSSGCTQFKNAIEFHGSIEDIPVRGLPLPARPLLHTVTEVHASPVNSSPRLSSPTSLASACPPSGLRQAERGGEGSRDASVRRGAHHRSGAPGTAASGLRLLRHRQQPRTMQTDAHASRGTSICRLHLTDHARRNAGQGTEDEGEARRGKGDAGACQGGLKGRQEGHSGGPEGAPCATPRRTSMMSAVLHLMGVCLWFQTTSRRR